MGDLMKTLKKILKIFVIIIIFLILCYGGIIIYAKMSAKLPINSANSFYLYDKNGDLYEHRL